MSRRPRIRFDYASILGVPAAIVLVVLAQVLEGAAAKSLWQPTAALVVFGGTAVAVLISYPFALVVRTAGAVRTAFVSRIDPVEPILERIVELAYLSRRKGIIGLEPEIERVGDPFLRSALTLLVDGASFGTARQILEADHHARRDEAEAPADVLETAAGYAPTLGILGAVLGLIHVMQSLSEPAKLGAGIAVAFVATVYGVASANLLLLPLATKLRGRARDAALGRELVIEGVAGLQEGLHPRLIEQKLRGYLASSAAIDAGRRVA